MNRDNFTKSTVEVLAKRVGYICSNPDCRRFTVGPSIIDDERATLIGVAAHITAASPGGPRFDENMSPEQRKHISNAIWLCSNCSVLIDKDSEAFSPSTLKSWKYSAESERMPAILGEHDTYNNQKPTPYIEADLIWTSATRANRGYSYKNEERFGGNVVPFGGVPIIYWELTWRFSFMLHNNSSFPAFNIKIEQSSDLSFSYLSKLPKVNNLPPYANIDLEARLELFLEGEYTEADSIIKEQIPKSLEGLQLTILYEDEYRNIHKTLVSIKNQDITNRKIKPAANIV
jgi:hypothetical protein